MLDKAGSAFASLAAVAGLSFMAIPLPGQAEAPPVLNARIVAVGIPGAGAVSAVALDGRVQLLTAQSAAFFNGVNTPGGGHGRPALPSATH